MTTCFYVTIALIAMFILRLADVIYILEHFVARNVYIELRNGLIV